MTYSSTLQMARRRVAGERGVALIVVLVVTAAVFVMGLGLSLLVATERMAGGHYRESVRLLYAADAGIELAARELARMADWNGVLAGVVRSEMVDGPPGGVRVLPGGESLDLDAQTNGLNCARSAPCTPAQVSANTRDRPWGVNNPLWRPFLHAPLPALGIAARPGPYYLVVWIADDGRESDGDPTVDGGGDPPRGRGVVRVRADAFGPRGARRAVEAELARLCRSEPAGTICWPGLRVQSWRELRQAVP
jgi:Tfp pilus assembly protein PilX